MRNIALFKMLIFLSILGACHLSCTWRVNQNVVFLNNKPICKHLYNLLRHNWKKIDSLPIYKLSGEKELILLRDCRSCILGLTINEVERCFGNPSEKGDDYLFYYLDDVCKENFKPKCRYLIFYVDKRDNSVFEYAIEKYKILE